MGNLSEHGRGVAQDDVKAAQWYKKAADQGHASAQMNLGYLFEFGLFSSSEVV